MPTREATAGGREPALPATAAATETASPFHPKESPADRSHPWWKRHDPYYEPHRFERPNIVWRVHGRDVAMAIPNGEGVLERFVQEIPQPEPLPDGPGLWRPRMLAAVAALSQYHTLSTRQLAAFGGWPNNQIGRILTPLYRAGLLEWSEMVSREIRHGRSDRVWRLRGAGPLKAWVERLDDYDWLRTTLGRDITIGGPAMAHVVHNQLFAEVALRAYETVPNTAVVYGERLADAHAMLPVAHPAYPPEPTTWRADGCLIRSDGLRLIFEVVHTVNSDQWSRKLAKWVDTLGAGSRSDSGAVLILLNAVLPEEHHRAERKIRKAVRDTLDAADPNVAARARTQIVCASWREWFPAPYQIGPAFCDLSASYWSGSKWRRVSLSDPEASRFDAPGFGDGLRLADLSYARPPWAP